MKKMIECHICGNRGIRRGSWMLCSMCHGKVLDLMLEEKEIARIEEERRIAYENSKHKTETRESNSSQ